MALLTFFPHFTPLTFLYLLFFSTFCPPILAINITNLLNPYPDISVFTNLLITAGVAADIAGRTSITVLAVPNSSLRRPSDADLADALRYHVLLEYLSWSDLSRIPPNGRIVTTLFQATGRAAADYGTVNITFDLKSNAAIVHSLTSNATILSPVKTLAHEASVFSISSLLIPPKLVLITSETGPSPQVNITKALIDGHNFNVAASMLAASGVDTELENNERGAGISVFMPTDAAFADLPSSVRLQSFPAEKKAMVLRFHVLHSYYPLGSLQSIVNPVQPTFATEHNGAGSFTLNISRINGSVGIDTGIVQALVTQTVFDQNPVAIYGLSKVLLPREFFGSKPVETQKHSEGGEALAIAQPPNTAISPGPSSHTYAPPGSEVRSTAEDLGGAWKVFMILLCIGFNYHVML